MKRAKFSEEQIVGVLKEAGAKAADLARRHGVSEATIYNWKANYGGLLNGWLWSTKMPKQHVRFQVAAEGHFMAATA
jgi:hypothetical protein